MNTSPKTRRLFLRRSALAVAVAGIGITAWRYPTLANALETTPSDGFTAFMQLSSYLTGKTTLDRELGQAIYAGLSEDHPQFDRNVGALNAQLTASATPAAQLQHTLDQAKSPLAALPKDIMKGWYLGVVGSGKRARAVAFEQALMQAPVADVVVMNTYARGVPGYWAHPPVIS